ncbi:MAG: hypothetical protein ABIP55_13460 [Tepidisphaeraceae bacterium]
MLRFLPMCVFLFAATSVSAQQEGPISVPRGQAQLFVDDFLIDTQADLKRTLHQPKKDDGGNIPVIALENEFGGLPATLEANGTIVYDPRLKKHVMFALAFCPSGAGGDRVRNYRFTSADGMSWIKGDDGTPQQVQFDLTDAASGKSGVSDLFSCYYDTGDPNFPYKGWINIWFLPELDGIHYFQSKDGKTWERGNRVARFMSRAIQQDGRKVSGPSDVTVFYHDAVANRFLASIKFFGQPVPPGNSLRSRAYAFLDKLNAPLAMESIDHIALLPKAAAADGDMPFDEYYGSTAWRYESLWLGGLKVWHGQGDYPYSAAGCAFLKRAVSRDGLNWRKVQFNNDASVPEVFIPNGAEGGKGGRNDGGYMTEFSQGPLRIGDELIFYYGSSSFGKNEPTGKRVSGGGIFRARLRQDGFVSVDGGTLTTRPLRLEGHELFVNGIGPITVTLLDGKGAALGSAEVTGDSLRHKVSFAGKRIGDALRDNTGRLRFTVLEGGRLYSLETR